MVVVVMQVVDGRLDTPVRGWVEEDLERILLTIGAYPAQVLLGLTERGALDLLDVIKRELAVLRPPAPDDPACEACLDTGDLWIPVARGAVACRDCHCQAGKS